MKKIETYTLGWDPEHKAGYFKAVPEEGPALVLQNLSAQEMLVILEMLRNPPVYTDNAGWLLSGEVKNV